MMTNVLGCEEWSDSNSGGIAVEEWPAEVVHLAPTFGEGSKPSLAPILFDEEEGEDEEFEDGEFDDEDESIGEDGDGFEDDDEDFLDDEDEFEEGESGKDDGKAADDDDDDL
jgi:hypothetical protein